MAQPPHPGADPNPSAAQSEAEKPPPFRSWTDRLDDLHSNVQQRISSPVRTVDEFMTKDAAGSIAVPDTRLRLGTYVETVQAKDLDISFKPDIDLDVAVPNLERRLRVFIQTATADNLPGRTRSESEDKGLTLGVRRFFEKYDLTADSGIRARWRPEAYARLAWKPLWPSGRWLFRPEQRLFFETEDRFGELSVLRIDRWLGDTKSYYIGDVMSAKWTQKSEVVSWEQTVRLGRIRVRIDKHDQITSYARDDVASGGDVRFSIFGEGDSVQSYRLTTGIRRPLYRRWIYGEVEPGLEWTRDNDFDTGYRLTVGIDMLFWGPAYR